jgi:hypothetical protein
MKLFELAVQRLAYSADASIPETAFLRSDFGHILRKAKPIELAEAGGITDAPCGPLPISMRFALPQ